jgi:hypothetical protein
MPRAYPNPELYPSLFLGAIDLDLNGCNGGSAAEGFVDRLVDGDKTIWLAPEPFGKSVVRDGLRYQVDREVNQTGIGIAITCLRQAFLHRKGVRSEGKVSTEDRT